VSIFRSKMRVWHIPIRGT